MTFFDRLKDQNADVWQAYTHHEFVEGMQKGSLSEEAFKFYLKQDYVFLIHFARAYALAAYKADNLEDMRAATQTVSGLIDTEMQLHVEYCNGWGISEADMQSISEAPENMAYTRYVLEKGLSGDILDLYVALAPCVIGYGEIGERLKSSPDTILDNNPYLPWIEMYSGQEYGEVLEGAIEQLQKIADMRLTEERFEELSKTFRQATQLEVNFWQMGLDHIQK